MSFPSSSELPRTRLCSKAMADTAEKLHSPVPKARCRATERSKPPVTGRAGAKAAFLPGLKPKWTGQKRWSCKFSPTGKSLTRLIPCSRRCAAGPMPESISICGVPTAPQQSTTSLPAPTVAVAPPASRRATPVAVRPSIVRRIARASASTVRFGRATAPVRKRKAEAASHITPRLAVTWESAALRCNLPLKSPVGMPSASQDRTKSSLISRVSKLWSPSPS
mmetsp:Transcript_85231/g.264855  ORF Transcript_85231/g.264855 Transcript_85231/m.264855 type:complete len:222 (+) Transcript_85231:827-1492(+)